MRNEAAQKKELPFFLAALFFVQRSVCGTEEGGFFCRRPTGTAERNKTNDRRETAKLPVFFIADSFCFALYLFFFI
jgi:hypothetical protein